MHYADTPTRAACGAKLSLGKSTTNMSKVTCTGCKSVINKGWN